MRHVWETWKVERFKMPFGWHPPLLVAKSSPMWAPPVTCANGQLWKVVLLLYHRPRKWPCPRKCWESPRWSNKELWIEVANYPKWNETHVGGTHFPLPWCGRKSTANSINDEGQCIERCSCMSHPLYQLYWRVFPVTQVKPVMGIDGRDDICILKRWQHHAVSV